MKPNTPAQIATGTALILRYGSWSAVREASVRIDGGWIVMKDNRSSRDHAHLTCAALEGWHD